MVHSMEIMAFIGTMIIFERLLWNRVTCYY